MNGPVKSVQDVADWRLCLGCGACAYVCPKQEIRLVDAIDEGIRPIVEANDCGSCTLCLDVCPAVENDHTAINSAPGLIEEVKAYCGPVLEIWEGHAADPGVRFAGSSGGLITALSLYCLEREQMYGVLHIGQDSDNPLRNKTIMSRTRSELMRKAGSRYAPASACDSLHLIEQASAPCVFVGQPTEVSAVRKAQALRPKLDKNVGLTISFFCAGSPATKGTVELLRSMGIDYKDVEELRYRGNGWPGKFAVTLKGESSPSHFQSYKESWGFVEAYRPFSVHLCPDGTGEDADISCGDPWYRQIKEGEAGSSILAVRTETGQRVVRGAIESGYVKLQPAEPWMLLKSQENLFQKRGAIWGRVATLRAFGLPAPKLKGFSLFKNWLRLSLEDKLRSTFGTARRIMRRNYFRPLNLNHSGERSQANGGRPESGSGGQFRVKGSNGDSISAKDSKLEIRQTPSVLVAVASYGRDQDHYLEKVLAEYRALAWPVRLVVLSNWKKPVSGAEVVAGVPSRDPYSLPFAHKKLFADYADNYDIFIYSEDDVLVTGQHIQAFLRAQDKLRGDEISGFIRSETDPEGCMFITSINHHFRWLPKSVVERDGELFAELSNKHSGCFIATRDQLRKAIASGGFLVPPHAEKYGMLETAASDLYTQCGMRRLISVSRIRDFIVPHLPNKYYAKMGIPIEDLEFQAQVLCDYHRTGGWNGSLFDAESRAPGFRWSKDLYQPDLDLLSQVPSSIKSILSVGCGSGANEIRLSRLGMNVCAVPLDAVFGAQLRRDGIRTVEGPLDSAISDLSDERFDAVMLADVLHLVDDPITWLRKLREALAPGGQLIASVGNTCDAICWVRDWLDGNRRPFIPDFRSSGVHAVSAKRLRRWLRETGYDVESIVPVMEGSRIHLRKLGLKALEPAFATRFIVKARPLNAH